MTFNIDISSHQKLATIYCSHRQNKTKWFDVWHNVFLYIVYLVFYIFECENPRSVGVVAYMLLSGGVSPFYSGAYLFIQTTTIRTPPPFQKNKFTPVRSVQCSEWVIVSYFGDAFTSTELVGFLKKNGLFRLLFTLFYRTQVYLGSDLWVRDSLTPTPM